MTTRETELLDLALAGRSPETKARVLELVLKSGVSPEDEFWLILVALKSLEVLILQAPDAWSETFATFTTQLDAWSHQNLSLMERKAKIAAQHSLITQHQTQLLSELVDVLIWQKQTSENAAHNSTVYQSKLETMLTKQDERLHQVEILLDRLTTQSTSRKLRWIWSGNFGELTDRALQGLFIVAAIAGLIWLTKTVLLNVVPWPASIEQSDQAN